MQLRDYQLEAVNSNFREFETVNSTLDVSPTGTGKNAIGSETVRRFRELHPDQSILWLAHRKELLTQARETIERHAGIECELELANHKASEIFAAPVLLASVQTMIAGRNGARRMHKFSPYNYGLIIVDEVHHSTAASYRAVLDYFRSGNPDIKILGLTATPERADEEALGQIFESVAFDYSTLQAIKDGWLVPIQQQLINIMGLDFSHIRTTAGDLNAGDLAAVMEAERNLYGICDATMKELGNHKGIMFATTVKQAEVSCNILNRYRQGVACFASGKTPPEDRDRIVRDYREGHYQLFVNCALFDEGADFPYADLLIDGYPTKSKLRYQQRLGRIMRPLPGIVDTVREPEFDPAKMRRWAIAASAKPVATVIDFVGNAGRHKLVHAIDVLGGNISDKARELVERKLRETGRAEPIDALVLEAEKKEREDAQRAEAARKARLTAKATYTSRFIDPFNAFDLLAPPDRAWNRGKVLSEKQRRILGIMKLDPDRLTYAEGQRLVGEWFRRREAKLCTLPQAACLRKFGYETRDLPFEKASELISALKMNGWRRIGV